jgi:hypothetical protein
VVSSCEYGNKPLGFLNSKKFLDQSSNYKLLKGSILSQVWSLQEYQFRLLYLDNHLIWRHNIGHAFSDNGGTEQTSSLAFLLKNCRTDHWVCEVKALHGFMKKLRLVDQVRFCQEDYQFVLELPPRTGFNPHIGRTFECVFPEMDKVSLY